MDPQSDNPCMRARHSPDVNELLGHAAWVRRLARRLLADAHLAEDVAQDALAAALERPQAMSGMGLRRWLGGTVRHLARARWVREAERSARETQSARNEAQIPERPAAERLELQRRLAEAVLSLDEPYRSAIVARYFDELPPAEIAHREGVSAGTVRSWLSRGIATLRASLDREFEGGRQGWGAAIAGLVQSGSTRSWMEVCMSATTKTVTAAALAVTAGLGWWGLRGTEPVPDVPQTLGREDSDAGLAEPAVSDSSERTKIASVDPAVYALHLFVRVRDEGGAPVVGARVLAVTGEGGERLGEGRTDAAGIARLDGREGAGVVLALAEGWAPALVETQALFGERLVELTPSTVLEGRAVDRSGTPIAGARLRLWSVGDPLEELGEMVRSALAEVLPESPREEHTDKLGSFRFAGLPQGWSGSLGVPSMYVLVKSPDGTTLDLNRSRLRFPSSQSDLELVLGKLPSVHGRLVWADTGGAVRGGAVTISPEYAACDVNPTYGYAEVDENGFFEAPLDSHDVPFEIWLEKGGPDSLAKLWLRPSRRADLVHEWQVLEAEAIGPNGDMGDVSIRRSRRLLLLVRDENGRPLPGARAEADRFVSEPADAEGQILVGGLDPEATDVLVGAFGYRVQRVDLVAISNGDGEPLEVSLDAGARLEFRIIDSKGAAVSGVSVDVSPEATLFDSYDSGLPTGIHRAYAAGRWTSGGTSRGVPHMTFRSDNQGLVELDGLPSGVLVEVVVKGQLGRIVATERVKSPRRGEACRWRCDSA